MRIKHGTVFAAAVVLSAAEGHLTLGPKVT